MNALKTLLIVASFGVASTTALAADAGADAARQDRMDRALQNYRDTRPNPQTGSRRMRAEDSVKRGAHRTGDAIKRGTRKVGHAVGTGLRKTGAAVGRGGEKLQDTSAPKP